MLPCLTTTLRLVSLPTQNNYGSIKQHQIMKAYKQEVNLFAHRYRSILKGPVYTHGIDRESEISMIVDIVLIYNEKNKHIKLPRTLEGIVPMLSILFSSSSRVYESREEPSPLSYDK